MVRKTLTVAVLSGLIGLTALDAAAWSSRAQRAIVGTAMQVTRRTLPEAFKTAETAYDEDVLRGAAAGPEILNGNKPFANDEQAIAAVENELQLLRAVRKFGFGSYFSYQMGALAALVADLMLPFALDSSPDGVKTTRAIDADIDSHLSEFGFTPSQETRQYIRSAAEYFALRRTFQADNKAIIADDYRRGKGYNGFMKNGAEVFFGRATEAVADAWYTVLRVNGEAHESVPSARVVTWYLVDEMRYLLTEKKNLYQALKTYKNFEQVNPGIPEAIEQVGDLLYAFGSDDARERAVHEWLTAYNTQGADRRRVGKKLCDYYIGVGRAFAEKGTRPGASDDDLPNALNAFGRALEFEPANGTAATEINKTNIAIADRKQRRELNVNFIASAEKVKVQAERSRMDKDFANAIASYDRAIGLLQAVDEEFPDQANSAKEGVRDINKSITDIINDILNAGNSAIEEGDKLVDSKDFQKAIGAYERVPAIVSVIPGDENSKHGKDKRELIDNSAKKIDEAKKAEARFNEAQKQKEEFEKAKARGGAPAPAADASAAAPPSAAATPKAAAPKASGRRGRGG